MIKGIDVKWRGYLKIIEGVSVMQTPKITHVLNRRDGRPAFVEFILEGKSKLLSIKHFQERYDLLISDTYSLAVRGHAPLSLLDEKDPEVA